MLAVGALEMSLICLAAAIYGPTTPRRWASLIVAVFVPAVPFLLPVEEGFWRCFAAVFALLPIFKWIQSTVDEDPAPFLQRMWQWSAIFDVRRTRFGRPGLDLHMGLGAVLGFVAGLGGIGLVRMNAQATGPLGGLVWYVGGLLAVLGWVQGITEAARLVHQLVGVEVPPIQRRPWLAASVREFWSQRWNRTVHNWLNRYMFRPLAKRGHPVLGVVWAFTISAAVHFYVAWVPAGPVMGLIMASFFMAQIPLVLVERTLAPSSRRMRRLFAIGALLGSSPLFILPLNAILTLH
ncbi:MAG: membrane bound O-acyl transferase family-domain-containing protein [Myxococcota bacterium]